MKFLNKILKNQRFKMITILFFLLILYTFFCAFSYANTSCGFVCISACTTTLNFAASLVILVVCPS